jgi:hypothetical protein
MSKPELISDTSPYILLLNAVRFTTKLALSETDFCVDVDVLNRIKFLSWPPRKIQAWEQTTHTQTLKHSRIHNINYTRRSRSFPAFQETLPYKLRLVILYFNKTGVNKSENQTVLYTKLFCSVVWKPEFYNLTKQIRCFAENTRVKMACVWGTGVLDPVWREVTSVLTVQTGETLPAIKNSQNLKCIAENLIRFRTTLLAGGRTEGDGVGAV